MPRRVNTGHDRRAGVEQKVRLGGRPTWPGSKGPPLPGWGPEEAPSPRWVLCCEWLRASQGGDGVRTGFLSVPMLPVDGEPRLPQACQKDSQCPNVRRDSWKHLCGLSPRLLGSWDLGQVPALSFSGQTSARTHFWVSAPGLGTGAPLSARGLPQPWGPRLVTHIPPACPVLGPF